jgi:RadC-like JAB domain
LVPADGCFEDVSRLSEDAFLARWDDGPTTTDAYQDREVFSAVMPYTRHRLIDYVELYFGGTDGAEVYPQELVRCAYALCLARYDAATVIVAHNDPSGETAPSGAELGPGRQFGNKQA